MTRPFSIEGLAIVSADHMIADAAGVQPEVLKPEADQRFFHGELAKADAVAHGRHSGEGGPQAARRRRMILTRRVRALERDPDNANAVLWNPTGASVEEAWQALGLRDGRLMVIGGTEVFGLFLTLGYDLFHLTRAPHVQLPGGRPVFPGIPPADPDALLRQSGTHPEPMQLLDAAQRVTLTTYRRG